jgi:hypothetical protein
VVGSILVVVVKRALTHTLLELLTIPTAETAFTVVEVAPLVVVPPTTTLALVKAGAVQVALGS